MPLTSPRCPVPAEQLPINEYQDMRQSWFYSWGTRSLLAYLKPLIVLWCLSWLISGPITAASFAPEKALLQFLVWGAGGAFIIPVLCLLQLYLGWLHVGRRLQRQDVPYEESGWYDGQVWIKPEGVLSRDRLIMEYQIQPVLQRIRRTLGILFAVLACLMVVGQFA